MTSGKARTAIFNMMTSRGVGVQGVLASSLNSELCNKGSSVPTSLSLLSQLGTLQCSKQELHVLESGLVWGVPSLFLREVEAFPPTAQLADGYHFEPEGTLCTKLPQKSLRFLNFYIFVSSRNTIILSLVLSDFLAVICTLFQKGSTFLFFYALLNLAMNLIILKSCIY